MTVQLKEQAASDLLLNISEDRDAQMTQRVIEAAIRCLDQLGLEKTTVDDIAREADISRATLYRRFGNKEAIFAAALQRQSVPFESQASSILSGPGRLAERVEQLLIWAVIRTPENTVLKRLLSNETATSGMQIFNAVFRSRVSSILLPVVAAAKANGELSETLNPEHMVDWIIRELLMIKMTSPWKEEDLREHIQHFITPVLGNRLAADNAQINETTTNVDNTQQRLTRLEQRLVEVHQLLALLRQDVRDQQGIRTT